MLQRRSWRQEVRAAAFGLGSVLVLVNLFAILFVPVLCKLSVEITVLDAATGGPVSGVTVTRLLGVVHDKEWTRGEGTTDEAGRCGFDEYVRFKGLWVLPPLGTFDVEDCRVALRKVGWADKEIDIGDYARGVPYLRGKVSIVVRLEKEPQAQ